MPLQNYCVFSSLIRINILILTGYYATYACNKTSHIYFLNTHNFYMSVTFFKKEKEETLKNKTQMIKRCLRIHVYNKFRYRLFAIRYYNSEVFPGATFLIVLLLF